MSNANEYSSQSDSFSYMTSSSFAKSEAFLEKLQLFNVPVYFSQSHLAKSDYSYFGAKLRIIVENDTKNDKRTRIRKVWLNHLRNYMKLQSLYPLFYHFYDKTIPDKYGRIIKSRIIRMWASQTQYITKRQFWMNLGRLVKYIDYRRKSLDTNERFSERKVKLAAQHLLQQTEYQPNLDFLILGAIPLITKNHMRQKEEEDMDDRELDNNLNMEYLEELKESTRKKGKRRRVRTPKTPKPEFQDEITVEERNADTIDDDELHAKTEIETLTPEITHEHIETQIQESKKQFTINPLYIFLAALASTAILAFVIGFTTPLVYYIKTGQIRSLQAFIEALKHPFNMKEAIDRVNQQELAFNTPPPENLSETPNNEEDLLNNDNTTENIEVNETEQFEVNEELDDQNETEQFEGNEELDDQNVTEASDNETIVEGNNTNETLIHSDENQEVQLSFFEKLLQFIKIIPPFKYFFPKEHEKAADSNKTFNNESFSSNASFDVLNESFLAGFETKDELEENATEKSSTKKTPKKKTTERNKQKHKGGKPTKEAQHETKKQSSQAKGNDHRQQASHKSKDDIKQKGKQTHQSEADKQQNKHNTQSKKGGKANQSSKQKPAEQEGPKETLKHNKQHVEGENLKQKHKKSAGNKKEQQKSTIKGEELPQQESGTENYEHQDQELDIEKNEENEQKSNEKQHKGKEAQTDDKKKASEEKDSETASGTSKPESDFKSQDEFKSSAYDHDQQSHLETQYSKEGMVRHEHINLPDESTIKKMEELERTIFNLTQEFSKLKLAKDEEAKKLLAQKKKELENLQKQLDDLKALIFSKDSELEQTKKENDEKLDEMIRQKETELEALKKEMEEALSKANRQKAAELEKARQEKESEIARLKEQQQKEKNEIERVNKELLDKTNKEKEENEKRMRLEKENVEEQLKRTQEELERLKKEKAAGEARMEKRIKYEKEWAMSWAQREIDNKIKEKEQEIEQNKLNKKLAKEEERRRLEAELKAAEERRLQEEKERDRIKNMKKNMLTPEQLEQKRILDMLRKMTKDLNELNFEQEQMNDKFNEIRDTVEKL